MELATFGGWRLNCDRGTTRRAYAAKAASDPYVCSCANCRNFVAIGERVYPAAVRAPFDDLGIDERLPVETSQTCELRPGWHLYLGWFHFVGTIEATGDKLRDIDNEMPEWAFQLTFHDSPNLVDPAFQGMPLVELSFDVLAPWVLDEPY